MFLTAGALVMALVLMLKANTLYAQCREILGFAVEILDGEFIAAGLKKRPDEADSSSHGEMYHEEQSTHQT